MKILIEGENLAGYLAKCHEAFRTGVAALHQAKFFGKGYETFSRFSKSYQDIVKKTYGEEPFDILIASSFNPRTPNKDFDYSGISSIEAKKAIFLCDYWSEAEPHFDEYVDFILRNKIDFIFSLFPQPLNNWGGSPIADRLIYMPPTFDPSIFKDWSIEKRYDVGFLADGTVARSSFYPERYEIHQKLASADFEYLWASHPGWGYHKKDAPLVGVNFSKAINSCRMFVTTGGIYKNPQPKIFEILASKALLLSDEPINETDLGLVDGVNYIKISADNILDKVHYFKRNPDELNSIAEAGYRLALSKHSCYARALDFRCKLYERLT